MLGHRVLNQPPTSAFRQCIYGCCVHCTASREQHSAYPNSHHLPLASFCALMITQISHVFSPTFLLPPTFLLQNVASHSSPGFLNLPPPHRQEREGLRLQHCGLQQALCIVLCFACLLSPLAPRPLCAPMPVCVCLLTYRIRIALLVGVGAKGLYRHAWVCLGTTAK